jgi:predicted nucleic acid-binding protein
MVLVDTSIWIAHFREGQPALTDLLSDGLVLMHPFISGELACGKLKSRTGILSDLNALPAAKRASDSEVMNLIDERRFWGHAGRGAAFELPFLDLGQKTRPRGS